MKLLPYFLMIFSICFLFSCTDEDKVENNVILNYEDENEDLYDFEAFPLNNYELPFFIWLPGETADIGTATKPSISHEEADYRWEIKIGQRFVIQIIDMGEMNGIKIHKEELDDLEHIFDIEIIEQDDNFIYYKRKVKQDSKDGVGVDHITYHCYANHVFDGINYLIGSHEDGVSKPIAEYMKVSVRNVERAR